MTDDSVTIDRPIGRVLEGLKIEFRGAPKLSETRRTERYGLEYGDIGTLTGLTKIQSEYMLRCTRLLALRRPDTPRLACLTVI